MLGNLQLRHLELERYVCASWRVGEVVGSDGLCLVVLVGGRLRVCLSGDVACLVFVFISVLVCGLQPLSACTVRLVLCLRVSFSRIVCLHCPFVCPSVCARSLC